MNVTKSDLRKLAKFSFWFGCVLCVISIFSELFYWGILLNDWFLLVFGISFLLAVPKYYFMMKDKEAKEGIYAYRIYATGCRKIVWALFSVGIICIVMFFFSV